MNLILGRGGDIEILFGGKLKKAMANSKSASWERKGGFFKCTNLRAARTE